MKKIVKLVSIVFIIIFCKINNIYGQTYEETYNLNFKIVDNVFRGWIADVNDSYISYETDTTDLCGSIRFFQKERWGFREKMNLNTYSSVILLPSLSSDILKVEISYNFKSRNIL